ncbi:MAG: PEP-CTERM sorting domain-containing protein [Acidobacteria bacterium]|nr:PEP-CTERM sorting domain-containing protein [Acidobacteriota bacterium]MBI3280000.1 PEP-CTERM sorting domain-containing protein [Acidobacteriota bacterium]
MKKLLLAMAPLVAWGLPTTIEPCPTTALFSDLINQYGGSTDGCSIGGTALWGFDFQDATTNPLPNVTRTPDQFTVNILLNSTTQMPRIEIAGPLSLSNEEAVIHFIMSFNAGALSPDQLLYNVALGATLAESANGNEAKVDEDINVLGGGNLAQMQITQGQQSQNRTFTPTQEITIQKEVLVVTKVGGSASIGTIFQDFTQVPEPVTFITIGLGLLAFGLARSAASRAKN